MVVTVGLMEGRWFSFGIAVQNLSNFGWPIARFGVALPSQSSLRLIQMDSLDIV